MGRVRYSCRMRHLPVCCRRRCLRARIAEITDTAGGARLQCCLIDMPPGAPSAQSQSPSSITAAATILRRTEAVRGVELACLRPIENGQCAIRGVGQSPGARGVLAAVPRHVSPPIAVDVEPAYPAWASNWCLGGVDGLPLPWNPARQPMLTDSKRAITSPRPPATTSCIAQPDPHR
jgi:hypothetical protein